MADGVDDSFEHNVARKFILRRHGGCLAVGLWGQDIPVFDKGKGMHDPDKPGIAEWLLANYKIHD